MSPKSALSLAGAEQACRDIPLTLPTREYRRRMDDAMRDWNRANLAAFDAQVDLLEPGWQAVMAAMEALGEEQDR